MYWGVRTTASRTLFPLVLRVDTESILTPNKGQIDRQNFVFSTVPMFHAQITSIFHTLIRHNVLYED